MYNAAQGQALTLNFDLTSLASNDFSASSTEAMMESAILSASIET